MREVAFKIQGMDCAEEVTLLRREVGPLVGGADRPAFDVLNGKMTVLGSPAPSENEIREAVARAGMRAEAWRDVDVDTAATGVRGPNWKVILVVASGLLTGAGRVAQLAGSTNGGAAVFLKGPGQGHDLTPSVVLLYALGTICGAWFVLPKAWPGRTSSPPTSRVISDE